MDTASPRLEPHQAFELRFPSLSCTGPALSFPCDAAGSVALDALSHRARNNYLLARALMGRDYGSPRVLEAAAADVRSGPVVGIQGVRA